MNINHPVSPDKEAKMATKRKRQVSVDTMVRLFMKSYDIPTKKDIDKVLARIDRLEKLVLNVSSLQGKRLRGVGRRGSPGQTLPVVTATDMVLDVTKKNKNGVCFKEIQSQTGFNEKKIQNIIFRLDKLGKIKRINRGIYTAV